MWILYVMKGGRRILEILREDIFQSVEELGVDLTEHIQFVIDALSEKAQKLGLKGDTTAEINVK